MVGGTYCFMPQVKASDVNGDWVFCGLGAPGSNYADGLGSTYIGPYMSFAPSGNTLYAQTRYVTASGTDYWAFLLIDKVTKDIIIASFAEAHISYGNGGNPEKLPHPFTNYDSSEHEIILLDQETCEQLKLESEATIAEEGESPERCPLTILNEDYKVNMSTEEPYVPLHSGKYKKTLENGQEVVTKHLIETIPDYISVRKLIRLTGQEKIDREAAREVTRLEKEQEKAEKEQNKNSTKTKLKALGLTQDEVDLLVN